MDVLQYGNVQDHESNNKLTISNQLTIVPLTWETWVNKNDPSLLYGNPSPSVCPASYSRRIINLSPVMVIPEEQPAQPALPVQPEGTRVVCGHCGNTFLVCAQSVCPLRSSQHLLACQRLACIQVSQSGSAGPGSPVSIPYN